MGAAPAATLTETLTRLVELYGEEAVSRALSLAPLLANVRPASDLFIGFALEAHAVEGAAVDLTISVPRKANQPTDVSFNSKT